MQGTQIPSLALEDPTEQLSPRAPRPLGLDPVLCNKRSHDNKKPARRILRVGLPPPSAQLEEA